MGAPESNLLQGTRFAAELHTSTTVNPGLIYINESYARGTEPHILVGTALHQLGELDAAQEQFRRATTFIADPELLRLIEQFQRGGCDPAGTRTLVQQWLPE